MSHTGVGKRNRRALKSATKLFLCGVFLCARFCVLFSVRDLEVINGEDAFATLLRCNPTSQFHGGSADTCLNMYRSGGFPLTLHTHDTDLVWQAVTLPPFASRRNSSRSRSDASTAVRPCQCAAQRLSSPYSPSTATRRSRDVMSPSVSPSIDSLSRMKDFIGPPVVSASSKQPFAWTILLFGAASALILAAVFPRRQDWTEWLLSYNQEAVLNYVAKLLGYFIIGLSLVLKMPQVSERASGIPRTR